MNESRYDRIEFVEVLCNDIVTLKWPIGDIDNLRNVKVNAIMVHPLAVLAVTPDQHPVVNNTIFRKSTLTLAIDGEESISNAPLTVFNPADNDGRLFVFSVPKKISWQKSFFSIATNAGMVLNESFAMTVFYEKDRSKGAE